MSVFLRILVGLASLAATFFTVFRVVPVMESTLTLFDYKPFLTFFTVAQVPAVFFCALGLTGAYRLIREPLRSSGLTLLFMASFGYLIAAIAVFLAWWIPYVFLQRTPLFGHPPGMSLGLYLIVESLVFGLLLASSIFGIFARREYRAEHEDGETVVRGGSFLRGAVFGTLGSVILTAVIGAVAAVLIAMPIMAYDSPGEDTDDFTPPDDQSQSIGGDWPFGGSVATIRVTGTDGVMFDGRISSGLGDPIQIEGGTAPAEYEIAVPRDALGSIGAQFSRLSSTQRDGAFNVEIIHKGNVVRDGYTNRRDGSVNLFWYREDEEKTKPVTVKITSDDPADFEADIESSGKRILVEETTPSELIIPVEKDEFSEDDVTATIRMLERNRDAELKVEFVYEGKVVEEETVSTAPPQNGGAEINWSPNPPVY